MRVDKDIFKSAKRNVWIKKYLDECGWGFVKEMDYWLTVGVHGFYSFIDEKEKQDPLAFRDAIIQGLQDIGNNDLEQVCVFVLALCAADFCK